MTIHLAFWKESMINRLSKLINRNLSAAKISQVLCFNGHALLRHAQPPLVEGPTHPQETLSAWVLLPMSSSLLLGLGALTLSLVTTFS